MQLQREQCAVQYAALPLALMTGSPHRLPRLSRQRGFIVVETADDHKFFPGIKAQCNGFLCSPDSSSLAVGGADDNLPHLGA